MRTNNVNPRVTTAPSAEAVHAGDRDRRAATESANTVPASMAQLSTDIHRKIAEKLPLDSVANLAVTNRAIHGAASFYLHQERELHNDIAAFSGAAGHGTEQFEKLLARLDDLPWKHQPRCLVALTRKIGEAPPADRLAFFRSLAIRGSGIQARYRTSLRQALQEQQRSVPAEFQFTAFRIFAMHCAGEIPRQAYWREPPMAINVDHLPRDEQLPRLHEIGTAISRWLPEHRKQIVEGLVEMVPTLSINRIEALHTVLNMAATLPRNDYVKVLRNASSVLPSYPPHQRIVVLMEIRRRLANAQTEDRAISDRELAHGMGMLPPRRSSRRRGPENEQ